MTMTKKPWERLDALLSALEEDFLRTQDLGPTAEPKDGTEAQETRAVIESAILTRAARVAGSVDAGRRKGTDTRDAGSKMSEALERLSRWAGLREGGRVGRALPQVRMAFSGERKRRRKESDRGSAQAPRGENNEGCERGDSG